MELIKDKIKENVERRGILLDLCKQIKEQDDVQQKLIVEEKNIAEECSKGLISKKVITTILYKDVCPENGREDEKIAVNNLGIGVQHKYGTQMSTFGGRDLLPVLKRGRMLLPFIKRKSSKMRLELFEDALKSYEEIKKFTIDFGRKFSDKDFDTKYTAGRDDKRTYSDKKEFTVSSPESLGSGYYDGIDIKYLSQYVIVEEFYDKIKQAYETVLQNLKNNNKVLKSIVDDTKEKLGPWLIIKEL